MSIKNLLAPIYAKMLQSKRIQTYATKLSYSSQFTEWVHKNQCRQFVGEWQEARRLLWDHIIKKNKLEKERIDYLEFGVHEGDSIKWWAKRNKNKDSRFIGFDSFEGLPETWKADKLKGEFSTRGKPPKTEDKRCEFQVGLFQDTLPKFLKEFEIRRPLILHLDADLYSSTLFVLCSIGAELAQGDILIFDEFGDPAHEFRAFNDFIAAYGIGYTLLGCANHYTQIAIKITTHLE